MLGGGIAELSHNNVQRFLQCQNLYELRQHFISDIVQFITRGLLTACCMHTSNLKKVIEATKSLKGVRIVIDCSLFYESERDFQGHQGDRDKLCDIIFTSGILNVQAGPSPSWCQL